MVINEIRDLCDTVPNSMNKIEICLLEYSAQFEKIKNLERTKYLYDLKDGTRARPPELCSETYNQQFIAWYTKLDELAGLHKFENYFKEEMFDFRRIKSSKSELQKWLNKK